MSHAEVPVETIDLEDRVESGIGDRDDQSAENMALEESNFVDGSGPLFTMYTEMAEEYDKKKAERWQKDADGILIFTGLFSAAVATLVSVSIQSLQPNRQDTAAFYLANIYQLLAAANGTHVSIPSTLSNPASPFTPPKSAIWVNSLWFLSLAISLTCALLATLLQQWVRRYIKITQLRSSPHTRGRVRAFFSEGIDNLHLPRVVEALPILLHLSLFLFFAGLLVFLFNIDHSVFSAIAWWVGLCTLTYISITFMPLFRYDSPYYAPLSSSAWFLVTGVLTLLFQTLWWFAGFTFVSHAKWEYFGQRKKHYHEWFSHGLTKTAGEFARKLSPKIDGRALMWTLDFSDEDQELGRFFAGIPGFCRSKVLNDPIGNCIKPNMERMTEAFIGLVHRTLTSNLVAPKVKKQRLVICREAISAASFRITPQIFHRIIDAEWDGLLNSIEFGLLLEKTDRSDPETAYHSQAILSVILPRVQERDDSWFRLATDHLCCPEYVLRDYLTHGNSLSLASSIRILRNIIHDHFDPFCHGDARWKVLELVSNFDIRGTLPTLQHEFCDLWNEIVHLAQDTRDPRYRSISIAILRNIRSAYVALHQGTDPASIEFSATDDVHFLMLPSSYPLCKISGHRLHPSSRTNHPPVAPRLPSFPTPRPYYRSSQLGHDFAPYPTPQNIIVSSAYVPHVTQINVDQRPGIVAPISDSTSTSTASNTAIIVSTQSSEPVPNLTSPATTTSASLPAQTSPSATAPPSHVISATDPQSALPDARAFPIPILDNTVKPPLVPQSAADPATSRSDYTTFGLESHSLTPVATSIVAPPLLVSALGRGTIDGEGRARVSLRNDQAMGTLPADTVTSTTAPYIQVRPPPTTATTTIVPEL